MGIEKIIMGEVKTGRMVVFGFSNRPRTTAAGRGRGQPFAGQSLPQRGKVGEPQARSDEGIGFQPLFVIGIYVFLPHQSPTATASPKGGSLCQGALPIPSLFNPANRFVLWENLHRFSLPFSRMGTKHLPQGKQFPYPLPSASLQGLCPLHPRNPLKRVDLNFTFSPD